MEGRKEIEDATFAKVEKKLTTLPYYVNDWYIDLRASYKTANTCRQYVFVISDFLSSISDNPKTVQPEQIKETEIKSFMISKGTKIKNGVKTDTSDSHKISVWFALNNFLEFMVKKGLIKENCVASIPKVKNHDLKRINQERVLVTLNDFNSLLNNIDEKHCMYPERNRAIVYVFMETGMRCAALTSINLSDIDFINHKLKIKDKGGYTLTYPLNDKAIDALNAWIEKRKSFRGADTSPALFLSRLGNRISKDEVAKLTKRLSVESMDISLSPHKLFRSGFASVMYKETGDIEKVRRMIGHEKLTTTQRYIKTENKEREEAASILQKLLV